LKLGSSFIQNKPQNLKERYQFEGLDKELQGRRQRGEAVVPGPPLKICAPPFHV